MPSTNSGGDPRKTKWKKTLSWLVLLIIAGILITILVGPGAGLLKNVPLGFVQIFRLALVLTIGFVVSKVLEGHVFRLSVDRLGPQSATTVRYATRLLLYVLVALAALGAVGVGLSSVVFGGAFLTVIIGLAGQTMFSNLIAGIWIVIFHPFRVGDSISFITWQYPILMPSFPHEAMRPIYSGRVKDINLMYTLLETPEEYPQVIPNGILVQAIIENRSRYSSHLLRVRFDVSYDYDPSVLVEHLTEALAHEFPSQGAPGPKVMVADLYPAAYSVVVTLQVFDRDDNARHRVLTQAAKAMQNLRAPASRDQRAAD